MLRKGINLIVQFLASLVVRGGLHFVLVVKHTHQFQVVHFSCVHLLSHKYHTDSVIF